MGKQSTVIAYGSTAEHPTETEVSTGAQHCRWHEGKSACLWSSSLISWTADTGSSACFQSKKVKLGKHVGRTGWERVSWECWVILNSVFMVLPNEWSLGMLQLPVTSFLWTLTLNDVLLGTQIASTVQTDVVLPSDIKKEHKTGLKRNVYLAGLFLESPFSELWLCICPPGVKSSSEPAWGHLAVTLRIPKDL